jgi:uncharacterized protein YfdQ (DUF2303 family)
MAHDLNEIESRNQGNLAETLARILPSAQTLGTDTTVPGLQILHLALPKGYEHKKVEVDLEQHLYAPRALKAAAVLADTDSFTAYVKRHATSDTVVWCEFNPQDFRLSFKAVFDEHGAQGKQAWRRHSAHYTPAMSAEWQVWHGQNTKSMAQLTFAEFLEANDGDINGSEGFPTSADMMQMAGNFEINCDKRLKSVVRTTDGGMALEFVDQSDDATVEKMRMFSKFQLGIPIFWAGAGFLLQARLKHRIREGKAYFHYELIRPDYAHETAARKVIEDVTEGIGDTPLLFGSCS